MEPEGGALKQVIYVPDSQLRHPRQLVAGMIHDLIASRELAWRLLVRNLNAQYRQTMLGYLWAFLPPVVTTLTFVYLNSQQIFQVGETTIPYPAYVMLGTLLWQVFVDALNSPLKLVTSSKSILAKVNFPREALILAGLGEVLFNFVIRLVLIIPVFMWYRISLSPTALWALVGVLGLIGLGLMIGLLLTPLGILYQDVERALAVFIAMWLLVTPVAYPPPSHGAAAQIANLNPVSPLIVATRELLTVGSLSQPDLLALVLVATAVLLSLGWLLYRLAMPHLIERMNA